jgi:hypothetical protein
MADFKGTPSKIETAHYESSQDRYAQDYPEKGITTQIEDTEVNDGTHVHNVLAHLSKEELLADVDRFATRHGLEEHIDDLRKGALLAQKPQQYMSLPELNDADRAIITQERLHKWKHPMTLYWTIFVCSVGAATQGCESISASLLIYSAEPHFLFQGIKPDRTAPIFRSPPSLVSTRQREM